VNLTARQVDLLNSNDPKDTAELLSSLGGDEQMLHQLNNMFGPGGQYYDPLKYGHTSQPAQGWKIGQDVYQDYADEMVKQGKGTIANGYYVPNGASGSGMSVDPSTSWSGVNASGGFTGGTGTGVLGQNGVVTNGNTYTNWTPPVTPGAVPASQGGVTPASLMAALNGGSTAGAGMASSLHPGTPLPMPGTTGSTPGSATGTPTTGGGAGSAPGTTPGSASGTPTTGGPDPAASNLSRVSPGNPMDFFDDAGYKFRLGEGQKAIDNTAAARGNVLSGPTMKAQTQYAEGLASDEYGKAYDRFTNSRDFNENAYRDTRNFDNSNRIDSRNFDNSNRIDSRNFDNSNRIDSRNFDYTSSVGDRNFNEDQRRYDLNTNLGQANVDRNFSYGTLRDLAGLGMNGANGNSTLQAALANLLSNNTLAGGGALAGGTVGGSNATNAMITQLLNLVFGNNLVNTLGGAKP